MPSGVAGGILGAVGGGVFWTHVGLPSGAAGAGAENFSWEVSFTIKSTAFEQEKFRQVNSERVFIKINT